MRTLSKSKLIAFRQCPKRLWLEVHRPELREDSSSTQASFNAGYQVGDIARQVYDPEEKGALIDIQAEGFKRAFERSKELLETTQPIFEAGFSAEGALAFADVLLPERKNKQRVWRMVEVKSSTKVHDYHRDDVAIQTFVAQSAGVALSSVALAHIDSSWVYPGGGDYRGLLKENDLTEEALSRTEEVREWIAKAQRIVAKKTEPTIALGEQCEKPFDCGFHTYCSRDEVKPEYPVSWLPRIHARKVRDLAAQGIVDLREVSDDLLNEVQKLVKECTLSNMVFFDTEGAASALAAYKLPAYFLDFESIQFPIPIWKGTRPYQQITFQFCLHSISRTGKLSHTDFLDLSGKDPSKAFAESLIAACGKRGPVFVYNAAFEQTRIKELAERYPRLSEQLLAINDRVVDLLLITRNHFYHPSQQGSWSIKKVLPAVLPELRYDDLDGVKDGGMAMDAFLEAIHPDTLIERKFQLEQQLLAYCKLDTYAMVRLWQMFAGRADLDL